MATIQVRTDGNLKKRAQETLKEIGLDLSSAINIYLRQVVLTGSIPFSLTLERKLTSKEERELAKDIKDALRGKGYGSTKEMFDDILGR